MLIREMKNINIENSEQFSTQTDSINQNAPLASMQSSILHIIYIYIYI